jgi:two-component system sensor histidine kinase ChvG
MAILQVFGISLLVTVLLSLYLAGTIARPIRRLALAAEQVRQGHGRQSVIPDMGARGDEIGELSSALREMTEALHGRMDAIEAFAADVAHEIKNPLTSLRSAVETAARVTDPVKQQKLLAIIQDDVQRLDRLISDISDASRIDAELSRAISAPVDLGSMLETLADVYQTTGSAPEGVHFAIDLPEDSDLRVLGIEGRLVQVIRNLMANALSFSPQGGTIRMAGRREGNLAIVEIEDDGPGIPENKLEAIFDRFYTERPQGEKFGTHSGLGLAISKQIIDAHRGTIRAENRRDAAGRVSGARFIVSIPALAA